MYPASYQLKGQTMNPLSSQVKIKLIEDDPLLSLSISDTLKQKGCYTIETFHSLETFRKQCNCAEDAIYLVDLRIGADSGMDAMESILFENPFHVVIITTSFGGLQTGAEAVKCGAFDVLEKPFTASSLLEKIELAAAEMEMRAGDRNSFRRYQRAMQMLNFGEKKVFLFMINGTANKVIASELNVSLRTIEMRRARILKAFGAQSVPELVSLHCKVSNGKLLEDALLLQNVM
jgi:two-component system response regulator FixJ